MLRSSSSVRSQACCVCLPFRPISCCCDGASTSRPSLWNFWATWDRVWCTLRTRPVLPFLCTLVERNSISSCLGVCLFLKTENGDHSDGRGFVSVLAWETTFDLALDVRVSWRLQARPSDPQEDRGQEPGVRAPPRGIFTHNLSPLCCLRKKSFRPSLYCQ